MRAENHRAFRHSKNMGQRCFSAHLEFKADIQGRGRTPSCAAEWMLSVSSHCCVIFTILQHKFQHFPELLAVPTPAWSCQPSCFHSFKHFLKPQANLSNTSPALQMPLRHLSSAVSSHPCKTPANLYKHVPSPLSSQVPCLHPRGFTLPLPNPALH